MQKKLKLTTNMVILDQKTINGDKQCLSLNYAYTINHKKITVRFLIKTNKLTKTRTRYLEHPEHLV